MLYTDVLLWRYCVQYGQGVFHTKHHKYINNNQIRENEDSRSIYDQNTCHSNIKYDHLKLILIQEH